VRFSLVWRGFAAFRFLPNAYKTSQGMYKTSQGVYCVIPKRTKHRRGVRPLICRGAGFGVSVYVRLCFSCGRCAVFLVWVGCLYLWRLKSLYGAKNGLCGVVMVGGCHSVR